MTTTTLTEDGEIQTFTVSTTGDYVITAIGADGGDSEGYTGGAGAEVQGTFYLTAGETLEILVGGAGLNDYQPDQSLGNVGGGAGGGGGTFVVLEGATPTLLEAAGGGGGAEGYYASGASSGVDGQAVTGGTAGNSDDPSPGLGADGSGGAGGSNGSGGAAGVAVNGGQPSPGSGGGGAGYSGDGGVYNNYNGLPLLTPAQSFQDGGAGGTFPGDGADGVDNGGFGGGGASDGFDGGGGGGYSGGGGGGYAGGGGGGSYVDDALATDVVLTAGENTGANVISGGDGEVTIADIPCFCRGVRIALEHGERAVEDLRAGDRVRTASGELRPIEWIGHRRLDLSKFPDPRDLWPVRVAAGAFGDQLPRRELWLSPGHSLAVEGALIPVSLLVNGVSIRQTKTNTVEYWHVELDKHDVLFAEGLPAESYLDTGNRAAFANGGAYVEARPDFQPKHWAETCLPLAFEGAAVAATKSRLLARLAQRGWRVDQDADAHIVVDGARIDPAFASATRLAFTLPVGGRDIALRSKTFVPAHSVPESADRRELGICVARLQIDGVDWALEDDEIASSGWREAEFADGRFAHRWTTGATPLPAGAGVVIVELSGLGYYLSAPDEGAMTLSA